MCTSAEKQNGDLIECPPASKITEPEWKKNIHKPADDFFLLNVKNFLL